MFPVHANRVGCPFRQLAGFPDGWCSKLTAICRIRASAVSFNNRWKMIVDRGVTKAES
jgi:hypothetical protein